MKTSPVTAFFLTLFLGPWSGQAAADASAIAGCAAIADDTERLRCFDDLAASLDSPPDGADTADAAPAPTAATPSEVENPDREALWLGLRPYRLNYILPVSYNSRPNREPIEGAPGGFEPEDLEVKFQISFELPVWKDVGLPDLDLYFAYTQLSFFQAYNTAYSSPFRDTAYEPEIGFNWHPRASWRGWRLESARLALNHQSNGRSEPLSRSWNRLIGQFRVRHGDLGLGLRLWRRFAENAEDDDNPDITDYLGHGELYAAYDLGKHRFGLMLRNPTRHHGLQLDWSYALNDRVSLYLQYFNGYGESLIDYDHRVERGGIGFVLNEWP